MLPPGFGTAAMVYSNLSTALVFGTHRVCPSSGSDVGELAEVDKHPLLALGAADPTVGPAALRRPPESAHPHLHYPGSPLPSPRPSPGSSACTPCRLVNGPS